MKLQIKDVMQQLAFPEMTMFTPSTRNTNQGGQGKSEIYTKRGFD